jgi:hypothetical protein
LRWDISHGPEYLVLVEQPRERGLQLDQGNDGKEASSPRVRTLLQWKLPWGRAGKVSSPEGLRGILSQTQTVPNPEVPSPGGRGIMAQSVLHWATC